MAEGLQLYLDNKAWLAGLVPIGTLDILEMLQLLVSDLHELLCDPKLTAWNVAGCSRICPGRLCEPHTLPKRERRKIADEERCSVRCGEVRELQGLTLR